MKILIFTEDQEIIAVDEASLWTKLRVWVGLLFGRGEILLNERLIDLDYEVRAEL